jgi:maltose alpha-D-glucosyltransferase/alpha-amylase
MIEDLWYKNAIIYSLDVDTFMDGNGDGIGDFEGLIRRLDYLVNLGVDVIWLAPFQPSPNRDNGYDISDYYGVDERHGSSGDFVEFIHEARKRGLRIMMDLVVNHTSDQHRWFQEARRNRGSRYRDWYVWSKKRPPNWNRGMVFPPFQGSTWTRDPVAKAYYLHRFYSFQPDLNMENPEVRTEIRRIIGFWLELGLDGFRLDAVPFIIEHHGTAGRRPKSRKTFEYLEEMRTFLNWRAGDAVFLGEANILPTDAGKYFRDGRGLHMMFNFWVNQRLFYALAAADTRPLIEALEATRGLPVTAQWAHFLRNHDELDLGRLTKRQRAAVFARFGPEETMQLYGRGIRRRLAPMLGNRAHVELAYSALLSFPGTPVLRYGDEIGMGENLDLPERNAVRTPMQWSDDERGGFSTSSKLIHPVVGDGVYGYHHINVEAQKRDPKSLLRWMMRIIRLRKECPEIGWGAWEILNTGLPQVLALCFDWRGNAVVVIHNFDEQPHELKLSIKRPRSERLANLFSEDESVADSRGFHHIALEAFGYRWYRVGDLNYALRRTTETLGVAS